MKKKQVWRLTNRDSRSYIEVVKDVPLVEGEASNNVMENLKISLICGKESVLKIKEVK